MSDQLDPDQTTIIPVHKTLWTPDQLEELAKLAIRLRNAKAAHDLATRNYEQAQSALSETNDELRKAQQSFDTYTQKELAVVEL